MFSWLQFMKRISVPDFETSRYTSVNISTSPHLNHTGAGNDGGCIGRINHESHRVIRGSFRKKNVVILGLGWVLVDGGDDFFGGVLMNSPHPLSPRAIPLISHQDVIHSSWHQIPVVEMIQQEFTCRYPLQNLFQPETNSKIIFHPSIFGCNSFFLRTFPWTKWTPFLTVPCERWAKWFTPSCWPSKIFPSVWPSIHKAPRDADSVKKNMTKNKPTKREQPEIREDFCWTRFVEQFFGRFGGDGVKKW